MPCEYCGIYDHVKADCPGARKDLQTDRTLGCLVATVLAPFCLMGLAAGCVFSALKAGFALTKDVWSNAWGMIQRKPDPPESA